MANSLAAKHVVRAVGFQDVAGGRAPCWNWISATRKLNGSVANQMQP
ncbi:hypothetical protein [Rhizobium sp. BR 315]